MQVGGSSSPENPLPPGAKPLESAVASGESSVQIPVADEKVPDDPPKPLIENTHEKAFDIRNQAFLDKMDGRIKQWKKKNGMAPLPIFKDKDGLLWWANREQRKAIAKRKRDKKRS